MDSKKGFTIETADDGTVYEGLRGLWCEVFGDTPSFVDALYRNFGKDVRGYAVTDAAGEVCSALTCYKCGTYSGRPVYVSYAVCTRMDMRGKGLAAMLTGFVRDEVTGSGGISIVSPAEPSLESFYAALGYKPFFFADEKTVCAAESDEESFAIGIDLQPIEAEKYNSCREAFLSKRPHIELSEEMLSLIQAESADGCGLYNINKVDAICVLSEAGRGRTAMAELIVNPALEELSQEIDREIASMIAKKFGDAEAVYRTPGGAACQSMAAGLPPELPELQQLQEIQELQGFGNVAGIGFPYFGFPID